MSEHLQEAPIELASETIVGAADGPHLLITGGVHGDEFEPMIAVRRLMQQLRPELLEPAVLHGTVTLVPVVNMAACLRGQRTAEDGLDLARVCPGRPDGSVTERYAYALSQLIQAADYYIDLHTGGTTLEVLPLVGYMMHPDSGVLEAQRRMARAFNLPIIWGTDHRLNGRSLSVARDAGVPAIYAEYHGAAQCSPNGVRAYVEGCLSVMTELGMLERADGEPRAEDPRVEHVVEDDRENSGYLQICHPAPITGIFEPTVRLGQRVAAGQTIGHVSDVLGTRTEDVLAEKAGVLLVLRTFSLVREGDSLAVILEV